MHGHIPPELIEKHPWIGVLIGLIGLVLIVFITFVAARDYENFSKHKSPELIDIENVEPDSIYIRSWVTITNSKLLCNRIDQINRTDPLEKLLEGPVYDTYIPITNSSDQELVVAVFHGDQTCAQAQNQPLTGILTTKDDHSYGLGYLSTRLSKTTTARLILYVGEGLGQTKLNLILALVFGVTYLLAIVRFIRLSKKIRQERAQQAS